LAASDDAYFARLKRGITNIIHGKPCDKHDKKAVQMTLGALVAGIGIGAIVLISIRCKSKKSSKKINEFNQKKQEMDKELNRKIEEENKKYKQEKLERDKQDQIERAIKEAQWEQNKKELDQKKLEILTKINEEISKTKEDELRTYQQITEEARSMRQNR
jgi:hypothetical protein